MKNPLFNQLALIFFLFMDTQLKISFIQTFFMDTQLKKHPIIYKKRYKKPSHREYCTKNALSYYCKKTKFIL
jgi:hypothetical protein